MERSGYAAACAITIRDALSSYAFGSGGAEPREEPLSYAGLGPLWATATCLGSVMQVGFQASLKSHKKSSSIALWTQISARRARTPHTWAGPQTTAAIDRDRRLAPRRAPPSARRLPQSARPRSLSSASHCAPQIHQISHPRTHPSHALDRGGDARGSQTESQSRRARSKPARRASGLLLPRVRPTRGQAPAPARTPRMSFA